MSTGPYRFLLSTSLVMLACSTQPGAENSALSERIGLQPALIGSGLQREGPTAVGDEPAHAAFKAMNELAEKEFEGLELPIYKLAPPPAEPLGAAVELAHRLGIKFKNETKNQKTVGVELESVEVRVSLHSGAEFFADWDRFHDGEGVPRERLLSEGNYVERAFSFARERLDFDFESRGMYTYKIRRFVNAEADVESENEPIESVNQVAVAFNASYAGVPVIGTGGKLAIHLDPEGEVVAFENISRKVSGVAATIRGRDFLTPNAAENRVLERLASEGVNLGDFDVVRREFGYFQYGRSSEQSSLVPHYAFFLDPRPDTVGKRRVEIVPAVTDSRLLEYAKLDEERDAERRSRLFDGD